MVTRGNKTPLRYWTLNNFSKSILLAHALVFVFAQIQLFEEQKVMLQRVESHAKHMTARELEQFRLVQQRITEHKWKRHDHVDKQSEILREETQNEHEMIQLRQQIERLEKEEENFKQFIGELGKITKKSNQQRSDLKKTDGQKRIPYFSRTPEKANDKSNASCILSSLRFLLPLSSRRGGILSELLRVTEQPLPDQAPVVYVERRSSVKERLNNPNSSVFYQIYESLKGENMNFRFVTINFCWFAGLKYVSKSCQTK